MKLNSSLLLSAVLSLTGAASSVLPAQTPVVPSVFGDVKPAAKKAGAKHSAKIVVPDLDMRRFIAPLQIEQIESLTLSGLDTNGGTFLSELETKDPALIEGFLNALRHAERVHDPENVHAFHTNLSNQITFYLKPVDGVTPQPIRLFFNTPPASFCYGPEFVAMLQKMDGLRAERIQRFFADHRDQLKQITFDHALTYRSEKELARIAARVGKMTPAELFATGQECWHTFCQVELSTGEKRLFVLLLTDANYRRLAGRDRKELLPDKP